MTEIKNSHKNKELYIVSMTNMYNSFTSYLHNRAQLQKIVIKEKHS